MKKQLEIFLNLVKNNWAPCHSHCYDYDDDLWLCFLFMAFSWFPLFCLTISKKSEKFISFVEITPSNAHFVGIMGIVLALSIIFICCWLSAMRSELKTAETVYYILWQVLSLSLFVKIVLGIICFICMIIIPFIFYYIPISFMNLFKKKEYTIKVIIPNGQGHTFKDKKVSKHEYLINKTEELINDITYDLLELE